MSLPLLFGVLTYLFILFTLTAWLTKYHKYHMHGVGPKDYLDKEEKLSENAPHKSEPKDSKITTSGKKSPGQR